jgi:hypothetical protein
VRWADIAAPPGAGKSTISYPIFGDKSVTWDGQPPPPYWRPFLNEIDVLMGLIGDHATLGAVTRMCARSIGKMATVERMEASPDKPVFIQTGLMQRILGFGWRLHDLGRDVNLIRRAVHLMPVSVGVVFLEADLETLLQRNRKREQDWREGKASHNENRSAQVSHMLPAIEIAKEALTDRGIPWCTIDVQHQSIDSARAELLDFAAREAHQPAQMGHRG